MAKPKKLNRYEILIERVFLDSYKVGASVVPFSRTEFEPAANKLGITLPKNLGDVIYSFKFRTDLPPGIASTAPKGKEWTIRPAGRARYKFVLTREGSNIILPNARLVEIKVPDATPGLIERYRLNDEQSLLARLRYNRLLDIFAGVASYSLQNHLRTTVEDVGQLETDEIYVGVDDRGVHYVFPVQAKGGKDKLNVIQVIQDIAMCRAKFPKIECRPIATQFAENDVIVLFELMVDGDEIKTAQERHYRLVPPETISEADLESYRKLTAHH